MILIKKHTNELENVLRNNINSQRDGSNFGDTQTRLLLPRHSAELGIFQTGKFSIVEVIGADVTPPKWNIERLKNQISTNQMNGNK